MTKLQQLWKKLQQKEDAFERLIYVENINNQQYNKLVAYIPELEQAVVDEFLKETDQERHIGLIKMYPKFKEHIANYLEMQIENQS